MISMRIKNTGYFRIFGAGHKTTERSESECEERKIFFHEAERMREAAQNYRLAPMEVKKYYMSLYYTILSKYGSQLRDAGASAASEGCAGSVSLYQNAEYLFEKLGCDLMRLAGVKHGKRRGV